LRPAVEDLWGAGAILSTVSSGLGNLGSADLSVEAAQAVAAFQAVADSLPSALSACGSGIELISGGYGEDVTIAGEYGASRTVPVLRDGAFTNKP